MKHRLLHLGAGLAIAAAAAAPAQAKIAATPITSTTVAGTPITSSTLAAASMTSTTVDTSMCTAPVLTQPFLSWQDTNWYALAPGQTANSFNGAGWVLTGGAKILTTTLADGTQGSVLDLPAGSRAVSPTVCLTSDYPNARMMISNAGSSNGGSVSFSVSYADTSSANTPLQTGTFKTTGNGGWQLSDPVALAPSGKAGWQPMQITLTQNASKELEVYKLYLDPRAKA